MITWNDIVKLKVEKLNEGKFTDYQPQLHKLNIFASSGRLTFLASHETVLVYRTASLLRLTQPKPLKKLRCDDDINFMRVVNLDEKCSVLVVVGEGALVRTFKISLENDTLAECKYTMLDPEAAWSAAANRSHVIVGSNTHKLTVWNVNDYVTEPTANQTYEIGGHDHNVPCVDIHPTLNIAATVSIDSTVRLWYVGNTAESSAFMCSWQIPHSGDTNEDENESNREWAWSVRWYRNLAANSKKASEAHFKSNRRFVTNHSPERVRLMGNINIEAGGLSTSRTEAITDLQLEYPDENDFLIVASKYHLYLLNSKLQLFDHLYYCPRRLSFHLPSYIVNGFGRLSLLEVIPEFSCILVASQTDNKVLVIRVVQSGESNTYQMRPEVILPDNEPAVTPDSIFPVASFNVQILSNGHGFTVKIVYLDCSFKVFQVTSGFVQAQNRFIVNEVLV